MFGANFLGGPTNESCGGPARGAEKPLIETGAPNLDCMEPDDLMAFWKRTTRQEPVRAAREMFPKRPDGYVRATRNLGHYAANKAAAMNCRKAGKIREAQTYENICEDIYKRLPEYAKW